MFYSGHTGKEKAARAMIQSECSSQSSQAPLIMGDCVRMLRQYVTLKTLEFIAARGAKDGFNCVCVCVNFTCL